MPSRTDIERNTNFLRAAEKAAPNTQGWKMAASQVNRTFWTFGAVPRFMGVK